MAKATKDERLLKIQALQDELKILNEDTEPQPEIEANEQPKENEEDESIQKPKKKKQLTQKQLEALKKGTAAIRVKQAQMAKEKAEKQALEKEVLEKKLIDKAIKLKKKQIKQNKILFESESESEEEQPSRIQKPKVNKQLHPAPETPRIKLRFV
jgi:hypothetical protein